MNDLVKCLYEFTMEKRMGSVYQDPEYDEMAGSIETQIEKVQKDMTEEQKLELRLLLEGPGQWAFRPPAHPSERPGGQYRLSGGELLRLPHPGGGKLVALQLRLLLERISAQASITNEHLFQAALGLAPELNVLA